MYLDIFKRHTKEDRLSALVNKQKKKTPERKIVSTFNRLIGDANRRIETKQNMVVMSDFLQEQNSKSKKKYNQKYWENYYQERFINHEKLKNQNNKELLENKLKKEVEKENYILAGIKVKKAPKEYIDKVVHRIYTNNLKEQS